MCLCIGAANLGVKDGYKWPEVHCKGSDTALLTKFLASWLTAQFSRGPQVVLLCRAGLPRAVARQVMDLAGNKYQTLCKFFSCVNIVVDTLAKATWLFLTPNEQDICFLHMFHAMACYGALGAAYPLKFKVKPKAHALCHLALDLRRLMPEADGAGAQVSCPNYWADCCWMDEDFIGRVCRRLVRQVSPQNVLRAVVERYVTILYFEMRRGQA